MKNLLLLLFIPFVSFSQSFKEIMSINSVDMFKKVVIENGYEYDSLDDKGLLIYGFNIVRDSIEGNKSSKWGQYDKNDGEFYFQFNRRSVLGAFFGTEDDTSENPYDFIVKNIKQKCKYYKIINHNGTDYVTYSCSESSYKGKIGFAVSEGVGFIRHFPTTK